MKSAAILPGPQSLLQPGPVSLPGGVFMHHSAELFDDRSVGRWKSRSRVVREECFLLSLHYPRLLELGEVAAQVGLVELKDSFEVAHAKGPLMKEVHNAKPIWVGKSLQDFGYVHERRVIQKSKECSAAA